MNRSRKDERNSAIARRFCNFGGTGIGYPAKSSIARLISQPKGINLLREPATVAATRPIKVVKHTSERPMSSAISDSGHSAKSSSVDVSIHAQLTYNFDGSVSCSLPTRNSQFGIRQHQRVDRRRVQDQDDY